MLKKIGPISRGGDRPFDPVWGRGEWGRDRAEFGVR